MGVLSSAATVFFLCACGTGLTLYAVHVQRSRQDDTGYRALCDVDEVITCSKIVAEDRDFVELIEWACRRVGVAYNGKFNPRQPALRIAFFPLLCFLGCLPVALSYFVATSISSVASLISAYLLYMQFQVHDTICLPCIAEYFIHILLFLVLTVRWAHSGRGGNSTDHRATTSRNASSKPKKRFERKKKSQKSVERQDSGGEEKEREGHSGSGGEKDKDQQQAVADTSAPDKNKSNTSRKRQMK